jgi:hypothetical protein
MKLCETEGLLLLLSILLLKAQISTGFLLCFQLRTSGFFLVYFSLRLPL